MTLIIDTAPLVAAANSADPNFAAVARALSEERGSLVVPAPVSAEVDYFLSSRLGPLAERRFLTDLALGDYEVECLSRDEYQEVAKLADKYADLRPGLADLSVVMLAARFGTTRILTFDHRHFRAMTPLQGGTFELLPDLSIP